MSTQAKWFLVVTFCASVLLAASSSSCSSDPQAEARKAQQELIKKQQAAKEEAERVAALDSVIKSVELTLHACDANGGIKKLDTYNNKISVVCNNSLSTDSDSVYRNLVK